MFPVPTLHPATREICYSSGFSGSGQNSWRRRRLGLTRPFNSRYRLILRLPLRLLEYNAAGLGVSLRYLILSDVHSNIEALDACLDLAQGNYDVAVCAGDLVGYGPNPNEAIDKIWPFAKVIIRGNHDKACCGLDSASEFNIFARLATEWTRQTLSPEHLEFLRTLPKGPAILEGFLLAHGSPLNEDEYILGPGQALPLLQSPETQTVCFGHTHYQGGFMLTAAGRFQSIRFPSKPDGLTLTLPLETGARYLINPGSVGQPRDGDWRAAFAILDVDNRQVEYYRTPYDMAATQSKMKKADLPEPLYRRLELGR